MALSFSDSKKSLSSKQEENTTALFRAEQEAVSEAKISANDASPVLEEEVWTRSDNCKWYNQYRDDKVSLIDEYKSINLNDTQVNISQEENSQFIPFEMDRYYDGIDLVGKLIQIHYINENKDEDYDNAVNIQYTSNKIRFAWLVDQGVTYLAGEVLFEIRVIGSNEFGENYCWISKPNGKLNIIASLSGNGIIKPDADWYQGFINTMNSKITEAANYVSQAQVHVQSASDAASRAEAAANRAQSEVDSAADNVKQEVMAQVNNTLKTFYNKDEVDQLINNIDLSEELQDVYNKIDSIDGLAKFKVEYNPDTNELSFFNNTVPIKRITLKTDPSEQWVANYDAKVDKKISDSVDPLRESIGNLPETLKTDYYNKEATDNLLKEKASATEVATLTSTVNAVQQTANTNKSNITTLSGKVTDLEGTVNSIDKSPRKTYESTYDEEFLYTLWEIENEGIEGEVRTPKSQFKIIGGGGGGGTSSVLKIEYVTKSPLVVTTNDKVEIKYLFSGTDSSGDPVLDGTYTWKIGKTIIATGTALNGENTFDATEHISIGTQKLMLSITDDAGSLVTKSWTVQKIDVRLESSFNDKLTYNIGEVSFDYIPYGAISKDVHFKLDGSELPKVTTASSGIPMAYSLPAQTHGSHLLDAYITAELNGSTIESNHVVKDIIWYDANSNIPVIGCTQTKFTVQQYDTINISYTVFDPNTETPTVELSIDDHVVSTLTLDSNTNIWQYKPTEVGQFTLKIKCRDTVKTLIATVEKLDIDIAPVTAGLAFDFNPVGRSNNDENRLWSDKDVKMTVSENFDWVNGGYQLDDAGDQYFCIKAGTTATISYNLFSDDARKNGKEFKVIFKTTNVRKSDATFLSCQSGTTSQIGLQMNVHEAYIRSSAKSLYFPYSEEDIIEFDFNIFKDTDIPIVMTYEDGTPSRPMTYTSDHSFTQPKPVPISIGSPDCDVYIYRMKAYSQSLTTTAILTNFIADARTATEMIDRYRRNQIYDENNLLTPESVAKACPNLKVIKLECPHFTNDKKDFVKDTAIECIHTGGDPVLDNWKATNCYHSGQGTTSNEYGFSGRNMDLLMCFDGKYKNKRIPFDENYKTILTMGDGSQTTDGTGKITLRRTSVPTNYLNIKVNIASSENENNALLQKRYNDFLPYISLAQKNNPNVKNTMEFYNCVVFLKENDPDLSTHREFQDTEWHFYALGNVGDSKKTDYTRVADTKDPKEFVVEIMDNTLPNSTFANTPEALEALEADQFDEEGTYGWRYEMDDITPEQQKENIEIWKTFYKFVAQSTDEDFVAKLGDYFVLDSALYFYLFTERYTMIDNRAKNTFYHYCKCDDGKYRFEFWDYDNDSALGINNSGELTMPYGKEDIDYRTDGVPSSGYIFNAAESLFFQRIRKLMRTQLQNMFLNRESENCWSASNLINEFDKAQSDFPEELWRLDYERKYERTYRAGTTRFLETMMNGRKKYHRRQFERDQEKYMATKYFGATATADQIMFRCNTPRDAVVKPNYTLHLTPYSDMYLSVMFGAVNRQQIRAKAGQSYDIECPFETMDDTAVLVYCASRIQSMGDVSACYIHDNDFSKAEKLKELIIGNTTEGYSNEFLTTLGMGRNLLLEKLDIRNTPNLKQTLDLSLCENLLELYATGSGLTGILFANGGNIRTALLPAGLTSINMRNLMYLTNLTIDGYDYISTIVMENCDVIDCKDILNKSPKVNRVRILGIDWQLEDTNLLDRLYKMTGIDKNGYNTDQSVLTGKVHVPVMREKKLAEYRTAWPDLEITYNTLITQYTVTFQNYDKTVLDVQYVDKGERAVDPLTREENPIPTPTKESTVSTDFTFKAWDSELVPVFQDMTITALYSESIRNYTVRYLNKGVVVQEGTGPYGSSIFYTGEVPTYTAEESAYKYYLFKGWDKSGLIDGDKDINAVYDVCEYNIGYFDGKELSELKPVEIYTMTQLGLESEHLSLKDSLSFDLGHDYSYSDIEEHLLISEKTEFIGNNKVDTGVKLFDVDKDFVLVIDFKFAPNSSFGNVLAQCYQANGINGFKLWYNNGITLSWGTSSTSPAKLDSREVVVLRHKKGETGIHVYSSNLDGDAVAYVELTKTRETLADSTLVFGCAKADDGEYENYGLGTVYWSKVWFFDLGDDACRKLASWTHETIKLEVCGFKKYYLQDNQSRRCSISFLASQLLSRKLRLGISSSNSGGWATSSLNTFLNTRLYNSIPMQWQQLMKKVQVYSSIGDMSQELSSSGCYVFIPSVSEVNPSIMTEPYIYEGTAIEYLTTNQSRVCKGEDGTASSYWLRSPNVEYASYFYRVEEDGALQGYYYGYDASGIRIMLCF